MKVYDCVEPQFYLQNRSGFGPQVIVHWGILSLYTNTDSLDNDFSFTFTCALLGFNPICLDGVFYPVLICFPHFCLEISGAGGMYAFGAIPQFYF